MTTPAPAPSEGRAGAGRGLPWVEAAAWLVVLTLLVAFAWLTAWAVDWSRRAAERARPLLAVPRDAPAAAQPELAPPPVVLQVPAEAPTTTPTDEAAPSAALAPGAGSGVMWAVRPTPDYPWEAMGRAESGRVRLSCVFDRSGAITSCQVLEETPPGVGFAREAVRATRRARVDGPRVRSGERRRIEFSVAFRMAPE